MTALQEDCVSHRCSAIISGAKFGDQRILQVYLRHCSLTTFYSYCAIVNLVIRDRIHRISFESSCDEVISILQDVITMKLVSTAHVSFRDERECNVKLC